MAYNYDIEKDKPPDTGESPSLGAQRIRYFKEAVIERLKNWIYGFLSDSETDEGLKKAPFKVQETAPTEEANKIILYSKLIGSIAELFTKDSAGNEIQITTAGMINPAVIDHGGLAGLTDDDHTAYYNSARHTKAVHDALALDHGALGGKADDDHSQYLNTARHDVTTRHPLSVLEIATGSYSEEIPPYSHGTPFSPSYYGHQLRFKGESSFIKVTPFEPYAVTTSYVTLKYQMQNAGITSYTAYAIWYYHSNSEQAIWGIWDKEAKKLIAVLVEENDGEQKLFPELKANQILVKFKNPEKFLQEDTEDKKAKIKEKTMAGYILEDMQIMEAEIEELK